MIDLEGRGSAISQCTDGELAPIPNCGESPRALGQRVSTKNCQAPLWMHVVRSIGRSRSSLVTSFAVARSCRGCRLIDANRTGLTLPMPSFKLQYSASKFSLRDKHVLYR